MIEVGQKVTFNPFRGIRAAGDISATENTVGVVKYVNPTHRWFSVEYGDDAPMRISFNFNDIGTAVMLCK